MKKTEKRLIDEIENTGFCFVETGFNPNKRKSGYGTREANAIKKLLALGIVELVGVNTYRHDGYTCNEAKYKKTTK